jgi:N-acyl-D-aspartate/D-glutamate deacylase
MIVSMLPKSYSDGCLNSTSSVTTEFLVGTGRQNWGKMPNVIAAIEAARASGLDVTANQYSDTASGTSLGATIPPKYHEGGLIAFVTRLQNQQVRAAIRQELAGVGGSIENMWRGTGGPQGILGCCCVGSNAQALRRQNHCADCRR